MGRVRADAFILLVLKLIQVFKGCFHRLLSQNVGFQPFSLCFPVDLLCCVSVSSLWFIPRKS